MAATATIIASRHKTLITTTIIIVVVIGKVPVGVSSTYLRLSLVAFG